MKYLNENEVQDTKETDAPYNRSVSGYGMKIPTSRMVKVQNRWRRIYCTIYSNIGTCWIVLNGERLIVR